MGNALKKITTRAKQLRKKKPGMSWTSAIKHAGVDYRAGRLGATLLIEKKETRRTRPKKVVRITRTKKGTFKNVQTVSGHLGKAKEIICGQIAGAELRKFKAHTKREKRKIGKHIAALKAKYRKLN